MEPSFTLFLAAIVLGIGIGLGFAIVNGILSLLGRGRVAVP